MDKNRIYSGETGGVFILDPSRGNVNALVEPGGAKAGEHVKLRTSISIANWLNKKKPPCGKLKWIGGWHTHPPFAMVSGRDQRNAKNNKVPEVTINVHPKTLKGESTPVQVWAVETDGTYGIVKEVERRKRVLKGGKKRKK